MIHNAYFMYAAQAARKFAETFEFPAIQKPNTFTIDDAIAKTSQRAIASHTEAGGGGSH